MKANFLILLLFTLFLSSVSAQECYFVTTKGNKIIVDCNSVALNKPDNDKFDYQELNSNKKGKINLDDITNALLGEYRIETFSLEKKPKAYFIIVETSEKKLVGYNKVITNQNFNASGQSGLSSIVNYDYFILDANNQLIQKLEFDSKYGDKSAQKREEVCSQVINQFSDCKQFIKRVNAFDTQIHNAQTDSKIFKNSVKRFDEGKFKILNTTDNPKYSNCNEESVPNKSDNLKNEDLTKYDGTYRFKYVTMKYGQMSRDMSVEGSYVIKNGSVESNVKSGSVVYKIKSIKDGVIYLDDKNDMVHTLTVTPETGKKKRFDYDTKIVFISDKEMNSSGEYFCIKE